MCSVTVSLAGIVCVTLWFIVCPPLIRYDSVIVLSTEGTKVLEPLLRKRTISSTFSGISHTSASGLASASISKSWNNATNSKAPGQVLCMSRTVPNMSTITVDTGIPTPLMKRLKVRRSTNEPFRNVGFTDTDASSAGTAAAHCSMLLYHCILIRFMCDEAE